MTELGNLGIKIPVTRLYAAFEQPNTYSARIVNNPHTIEVIEFYQIDQFLLMGALLC